MKIVRHVADDTLERYSMQTLPEAEAEPVEKHLLTCQDCRDRLQAEIDFIAAVRGAARGLRENDKA